MAVPAIGLGLQAIGTGLSMDAAGKQADAERAALRGKALLQRKQADERLRQLKTEVDIFKQNKEIAMGDSVSSYAKAGVAMTGSPMMVLGQTERNLQSSLADMERKGLKEVELIREGAQQLTQAADRVNPRMEQAGILTSGLAGGLDIANKAKLFD